MACSPWGPGFDRFIRWTKKEFGLYRFRSVLNLRVDGVRCAGICTEDQRSFTIQIDRSLTEQEAIDTLTHELAHRATAMKYGWKRTHHANHGKRWGQAFAKIYCKTTDYFDKQRETE